MELLVGFDRGSGAFGGAFGKRLSVGLLAGVGLGDDLETANVNDFNFTGQHPDSNSPIVGGLLEVNLYRGLYVEADGFYRPLHATVLPGPLGPGSRYAVLTWEFPVLAKYKLRPEHRWRPVGELGPSFRLDGNFNGPTPSHYGITAGSGVETRLWKVKISPALHYTRWAPPRTLTGGGTFLNEVQALVGVSF